MARWCPLVFFFSITTARHSSLPPAFRSVVCPPPHVPSLSPRCPRPFLGWVEEKGVGGGRPRCLSSGVSTSRARRHKARHLSLCRWGGGLAVWLPSSPFLPCGRTPGGPPVGACTARAPFGHGRVVRPAPSLRCLSTLPLCPGGGSAFRYRHPPPSGGRWCVGGGGAPLSSSLHSTHVAGTTQARRKSGVRHLAAVGGGGFLLWGPLTPEVGYLTSVSCGPMSPRPPPVRRGIGPCLLAFVP